MSKHCTEAERLEAEYKLAGWCAGRTIAFKESVEIAENMMFFVDMGGRDLPIELVASVEKLRKDIADTIRAKAKEVLGECDV